MKVLIVTVAGISSRFSQSIGEPTIKCLFHKNSIEECLLYTLLEQSKDFDKYIIVGGYRYGELKSVLENEFTRFLEKIILVENEHYEDFGSGYSLFVGLMKAIEIKADDIVFAEGDLFLDKSDYSSVCKSKKSVITVNNEHILANKAVALYQDEAEKVHYIYDTGHKSLIINEPFIAIYNSGQVWKFSDEIVVKEVFSQMNDEDWQGTNLVFVEKYFQCVEKGDIEYIAFSKWINCNTVDDFNKIGE